MASAPPLRVVWLDECQRSGVEGAAAGTAAGTAAPLGLGHRQAGAGAGLWDAAHWVCGTRTSLHLKTHTAPS